MGNFRHFFSISNHKANTTELHPKVRKTCSCVNSNYFSGFVPELADNGPEEQHEEDRAGRAGPAGADAGVRPRQEDLRQEGSAPPLLRRPGQDLLASQARRVRDQNIDSDRKENKIH